MYRISLIAAGGTGTGNRDEVWVNFKRDNPDFILRFGNDHISDMRFQMSDGNLFLPNWYFQSLYPGKDNNGNTGLWIRR